jgi:cytoskeletal protein CcmA (bactofilin family)
MFSRNTDMRAQPGSRTQAGEPGPAPPEPAAQRRTTPRPASVLAADMTFEGQVRGKGELQIDGSFSGDIEVRRLLVAHSARVEGAIRCETVEIRGRMKGDIRADVVKIYETAHVEGDVLHRQLSIDAGAVFEGRSQRLEDEPSDDPAPAPPPAPPALLQGPVIERVVVEDEVVGAD